MEGVQVGTGNYQWEMKIKVVILKIYNFGMVCNYLNNKFVEKDLWLRV